jgi:hypothetical protein
MLGEDAEFDVFISYRVASDAGHVECLYNLLTNAGFKASYFSISIIFLCGNYLSINFIEGIHLNLSLNNSMKSIAGQWMIPSFEILSGVVG